MLFLDSLPSLPFLPEHLYTVVRQHTSISALLYDTRRETSDLFLYLTLKADRHIVDNVYKVRK